MFNPNHHAPESSPDRLIHQVRILSRQVHDLDEFSQSFQGFGYTITQLSQGPCQGEFLLIQMEGVRLFRVRVSCAAYTTGSRPADEIGFCLPLNSLQTALVAHKVPLPVQSLFGLDVTRGSSLVSPQHMELALVTMPVTKFKEYLHHLDRDDIDDRIFKRNYVQTPTEAHYALQAYLKQIFYLAEAKPDLLRRSQFLIQGDLLPLIINCFQAETCPQVKSYPFRRAPLVQQAEEFILGNLDQPLTLQDICQAVKGSRSALTYGFQEIFGMSPMAYLKMRRLNGVRYALKRSDPKTDTILGIANRYGFWHMGHFARDYKELFNELPSETFKTHR